MTRVQRMFLGVVILALLVCWSPSKTLPYAMPLAAVGLMLLTFRQLVWWRWMLLLLALGIWFLLDLLLYPDFILQNGFLALVTYSSFFIILIVPSRYLASRELYSRICYIVIAAILLEGAIGLVQIGAEFARGHSFDLNAGDVVEGTIDLPLPNAPGFETPAYAAMMAFSLLFLVPAYSTFRGRSRASVTVALLIGGAAFLLASVVHSLVFLLISVIAAGLVTFTSLSRVRLGPLLLACGGSLLIFVVAYLLLPRNIGSQLPAHLEGLQSNPKVILVERMVDSVDRYPQLLFAGLGPGQGVSRAALIATGDYLSTSIRALGLRPHYTEMITAEMLDLWQTYGRAGSTLRPLSSWIGAFSEVGLLGVLLGLSAVLFFFFRPSGTRPSGRPSAVFVFAFRAALLYLFLLGFQEYYWESPQAIFMGILFIMVLRAQTLLPEVGRTFGAPVPVAE